MRTWRVAACLFALTVPILAGCSKEQAGSNAGSSGGGGNATGVVPGQKNAND